MKISREFALAATLLACAFAQPAPIAFARENTAIVQTIKGVASWYGGKFHGRLTANGERYDMNELTAAHPSLPFGSRVRVTNRKNGRSVIVRINDRGPYIGRRIIDLSHAAASKLGMVNSGTAPVTLEVLG